MGPGLLLDLRPNLGKSLGSPGVRGRVQGSVVLSKEMECCLVYPVVSVGPKVQETSFRVGLTLTLESSG